MITKIRQFIAQDPIVLSPAIFAVLVAQVLISVFMPAGHSPGRIIVALFGCIWLIDTIAMVATFILGYGMIQSPETQLRFADLRSHFSTKFIPALCATVIISFPFLIATAGMLYFRYQFSDGVVVALTGIGLLMMLPVTWVFRLSPLFIVFHQTSFADSLWSTFGVIRLFFRPLIRLSIAAIVGMALVVVVSRQLDALPTVGPALSALCQGVGSAVLDVVCVISFSMIKPASRIELEC